MNMRTYCCIAPNPALSKRTAHNKLIAKELQDDHNMRDYSKSTSNFILFGNQAKLHHMIML